VNTIPNEPTSLLFTAFEPSGDDHASAVIAELKRRYPTLPIYAWGGPKMARAGATIIERTGDDAVVGLPGVQKIIQHHQLNDRVKDWLRTHPTAALVPVDSPAANFPLCKYARSMGIQVVHLVAPQIWAWGRWRIHKLRASTNIVLCILPFEEPFFNSRGVPAKFIGHPLFDTPLDLPKIDARLERHFASSNGEWIGHAASPDTVSPGSASPVPAAGSKLSLFPGSRPSEIKKNFPLLLAAFRALQAEFPTIRGVVAAVNHDVAAHLKTTAATLGGWPDRLGLIVSDTEAAIRWCDLALVKSGTTTLQIARQRKPMVVFYKISRAFYNGIVRWLVSTKFYTLPNALAHRQIVPELVPHFGDHEPIVAHARALLRDPEAARRQQEELGRICEGFSQRHAAKSAADEIARITGLGPRMESHEPSSAAALTGSPRDTR
jgi:lipid-A-disaccharide synthase